jgi:hypothetical protein
MMRGFTRENAKLAVVGSVCLVAGLVGPAAAGAAFDANNADKVDGKHAVGAGASANQRAGKLVATDGRGRFPSNSIAPGFLTAAVVEWMAVRDDRDIREQSDPNATLTRVGTGQYCIEAPGAFEGAVGSLQKQGTETAGTIRVSLGIVGICGGDDDQDANITVETFG